jgi:uncharacterized protein YlxW (UPF0749 family)
MSAGGVPTRLPELVDAIRDAKRQNQMLKDQVEELQKKLTDYEKQLSSGTTAGGMLNRELQEAKFQAGLTSVEGAGVIVTLMDSPQKNTADAPPIDLIIHDSDIRNFINELVAAGAEAISVNDQRVISRSAIRCVGPVIQVNNTEIVAPYEIKAIGDPRTLEGALRLPQGIVDSFPDTQMVTIRRAGHIVIKPYTGGKPYKWARPVER